MSNPPTNMFSQQTGHKYTFQLQLKKLFVTPSLPFQVKIVWARNQNRIQSQNPIKLQPPQNQVTLHQCFCNKSTVLFNPKKLQFRKKQSRIQVVLYANGSPKQGGQFVLNLCEILDPFNIKKQQEKVYKVVTRQQKPRCELQFKLTAEYCQQMIRDEQREVGSISSKNTTSLNQGPSIISGFQAKQYVQKKNLFLYEAPSKDNQSVTSYNSYSTGMMRYNSGKKEREDSIKKEDYGLSTRREVTTGTEFTKTASVNMKEFDTKSKGGYNRVTMQQNYDNRTENYDPQTSKQLQEEQAKRSKLEAQVSRLNIYMKQQSAKLTEYIQENAKLKEQLGRLSLEQQNIRPALQKQTSGIKLFYEQQLSKMRQDNDELHNRTFELNNQNRELTRRYEQLIEDKEKIQEQLRKALNDKQRTQTRFQSLNRNLQTLANHKQLSTRQAQNLRDQLDHIKSLNANLRDSLEKERRKFDQIQYANTYHKSTLQQSAKKKQLRLSELQRDNSTLLNQIKERQRQLQTKKDLLYRLQRSSTEFKDKLLNAESDKNRFFQQNGGLKVKLLNAESDKNRIFQQNGGLRLQIDRLRRELSTAKDNMSKLKDQKTAQYQQKNTQLQGINYQNQQKIRTLEYQLQQNLQKSRSIEYELDQNKKNYSQIVFLNETIRKELQDKKNEILRLEASMRGLKEIEARFYSVQKLLGEKERTLSDKERVLTDKERQIVLMKGQMNKAHYRVSELQDQLRKVSQELQQVRKTSRNVPDVDINQILRETVQMQVQLKFKTDQLLRLKNIQERHEQLLYQLQQQSRNKKQLQDQLQRLEKEVKDKNKLYLIEVEKGKLILREKTQLEKVTDQLKLQLKKCHQIIFNGDRQLKDMQNHIRFLQQQNITLKDNLASTQTQINVINNQLTSYNQLQSTFQQLQSTLQQLQVQLHEKTLALNTITLNLNNAHKRIHQLETITSAKQSQAQQAIRTAQSSSQKLIQLESNQSSLSQELQKSIHQKKSLELKCDTMMQELHSLKKQFEQEKLRSTSVVSIRSSEDQLKIRQLQNQIQKKEKLISKLTKQKLQIQEQNINLHVQVMKKLSEMEKTKDLTSTTSQ